MLLTKDVTDNLKPYVFHGLDVELKGKEGVCQCPFCDKEDKFSINIEKGLWRCLVCGTGSERGGGNSLTFIRELWKQSYQAAQIHDYQELKDDRGLLFLKTFKEWGVCKSIVDGVWMIPAFNSEGKLCQLYRYALSKGKKVLYGTPNLGVGLFQPISEVNLKSINYGYVLDGLNGEEKQVNKRMSDTLYLCEGPWDGMALYEVNRKDIIKSIPGCGSVGDPFEKWSVLFTGKDLVLMFDNDHEKVNSKNGKTLPPAAFNALKRAVKILSHSENKPRCISYLKWGENGYDSELPNGYDIRDCLKGLDSLKERQEAVDDLLLKVELTPAEWIAGNLTGTSANGVKDGSVEISLTECKDWKTLRNSWLKAMKWIDGLEKALIVMLSSVVSTKALGDQLWVKIIGPPSCGKSTLCEALSVNKEFVLAKSTIRGFHSGFKSIDGEDNALLNVVHNKTLITKDGDTLLQSPNLPQILSEARDVYDRTSRTHYRHGMTKDYDNINMTWILCGTSSLKAIDSSELGERFLDCVIMESIDEDTEDDILGKVAYKALFGIKTESNGKMESQHDTNLLPAMQLTGGYVSYLRNNASELLSRVEMDNKHLNQCKVLGKYVSYLRARPSKTQSEETVQRELAARLVGQLVRLSVCAAVVLGKTSVDDEVMVITTKVAKDTARGITRNIVEYITNSNDGLSLHTISNKIGATDKRTRELLQFMQALKIITTYSKKLRGGVSTQTLYKLTDTFSQVNNLI